jgi:AbrB family looped-hinge helix DNA binding protein
MQVIKLGEKGQITLPKAFREHYHLRRGSSIRVVDLGNGIINLIPVEPPSELNAPVFSSKSVYSVEDMNEAIGQEISEHYR